MKKRNIFILIFLGIIFSMSCSLSSVKNPFAKEDIENQSDIDSSASESLDSKYSADNSKKTRNPIWSSYKSDDVISIENAQYINNLGNIGKGIINDTKWSQNGEILAVGTSTGIYLLGDNNLQERKYIDTGNEVISIGFSDDGRMIYWVGRSREILDIQYSHLGYEYSIKKYDLVTEEVSLEGTANPIDYGFPDYIEFSPECDKLAANDFDKIVLTDTSFSSAIHSITPKQNFEIWDMEFSTDGKYLATSYYQGNIQLWDVERGYLVSELQSSSTGNATKIKFSPDGQFLAAGMDNGTILLWDIHSIELISVLKGHQERVIDLAFSNDGAKLTSSGYDHSLSTWDVITGEITQEYESNNTVFYGIDSSPNDDSFLTIDINGFINIWRYGKSKSTKTISGFTPISYSSPYPSLSTLSLDGNILCSVGADNSIRLKNLSTDEEIYKMEVQNQDWNVEAIDFAVQRNILAYTDYDYVKLINVKSGKEIYAFSADGAQIVTLEFFQDGQFLAVAGEGKSVYIYDLDKKTQKNVLDGHDHEIKRIAISPDNSLLSSIDNYGTIIIWDILTSLPITNLSYDDALEPSSIAFSPDNEKLIVGFDDGIISMWDITTGNKLIDYKGHRGSVNSISFSHDGLIMASGGSDCDLRIWNFETGEPLRNFKGRAMAISNLLFSPDDKFIVSVYKDQTASIWGVNKDFTTIMETPTEDISKIKISLDNIDKIENIRQFGSAEDGFENLAFSTDYRMISLSYDDKTIIYDVGSGNEIQTLRDGYYGIFSPDGKSFLGKSSLWDLSTGEMLCSPLAKGFSPDGKYLIDTYGTDLYFTEPCKDDRIITFEGMAPYRKFSPDGKILISISKNGRDDKFHIWDVENREIIYSIPHQADFFQLYEFSPDGQTLVMAGYPGIMTWNFSLEEQPYSYHDLNFRFDGVAFSPNGNTLVASDDSNGNIYVIDYISHSIINVFSNQTSQWVEIDSLSFSKDGDLLATGSHDHIVRVFDFTNGSLLFSTEGDKVYFSADGTSLFVQSGKNIVHVWEIP